MTTTEDLKSTLNLPQTDFPMKANLPQAEPRRLEAWKAERPLRAAARSARKGAPLFVLHDGPPYANGHIHLGHRAQQDPEGPRGPQPLAWSGYDAPYVPGLGLPRPAHRAAGGQGPGRQEEGDDARSRSASAAAPTPRSSSTSSARSSSGWASWASGTTRTSRWRPVPGHDRARAGRLRGEGPRLQGQEVGALVHLVTAPRWPRPRSSTTRTTSARRSTCASRCATASRRRSTATHPALHGPARARAVIWTTTPWTLPANLALAFHPDADYALLPGRGHRTRCCCSPRRCARPPRARWNRLEPRRSGEPLAEVKGARARGRCASAIPGSTATRPACWATTSRSTPAPASCTPRPATAGTTT